MTNNPWENAFKSSKELWSKEKEDRQWIFYFIISLVLTIIGTLIVAIIGTINLLELEKILKTMNPKNNAQNIFLAFVSPFYIVALTTMASLFFTITGYFKSKKLNSYRFLSGSGNKILIFSVFALAFVIFNNRNLSTQISWIIGLVVLAIMFGLIFVFATKYQRIQSKFLFAYKREQQAEAFKKMGQNGDELSKIMNVFTNASNHQSNNSEAQRNSNRVTPNESKIKSEKNNDGLDDLSKNQLILVAKKLYISGTELMSRNELIKIIRQQKNAD